MIGSALSLDLPALSDPFATAVAKIRAALSALETTVESKVSQAGIALTDSLDCSGNGVSNVGQVKLASTSSAPTTAGSLYYSGNELWFRDAAGAVKITNAGTLNLSGSTGFIGDYGALGVSAGAYYDVGSAQYRFYSNSGTPTYGDVVARSFLLTNSGFTAKIAAPTLGASYQVTLPASPPGIPSIVQMSASGVLSASNTVGDITATSLKLTGTMTTSTGLQFQNTTTGAGFSQLTGGTMATCIKATGSPWQWVSLYHPNWGLKDGDKVTAVKYSLPTTTAGTYTFKYCKQVGTTETVIDTWTEAGGSAINATHTVASPAAIVTGENHFVFISFPSTPATTDVLTYVGVSFTHP